MTAVTGPDMSRSGDVAIEVERVSRAFGRGGKARQALSTVSFSVERGTIVALLGENGAGKTTLTRILGTLLYPSSGSARIHGHDVVRESRQVRRLVSVVLGGDRGFYPRLSGRDNLHFVGALAGIRSRAVRSRVTSLLEQVGLADVADRKVETYSRGMKQRLHIAAGLIPEPQVLLLDEPTLGLDVQEATRLRESVRELAASGTTILLTSHYVKDIEELASRVLLLKRGSLVADLSLREFARLAGWEAYVAVAMAPGTVRELERLAEVDVIRTTEESGSIRVEFRVLHWTAEILGALQKAMLGSQVEPNLRVRESSLEDALETERLRHLTEDAAC